MLEFVAFINNAPILLVVLYIIVEAYKEYARRRNEKQEQEAKDRAEVTDSVFRLYGLAKADIENEKIEIHELTVRLKRANVEIAILERKVAALMRVLDVALKIPEISEKYEDSMQRFAKEASEMKKGFEKNDEQL